MIRLHVQLLARAIAADYVVSANTRDFPNRVEVQGATRGELEGIVWITPDQIFYGHEPSSVQAKLLWINPWLSIASRGPDAVPHLRYETANRLRGA